MAKYTKKYVVLRSDFSALLSGIDKIFVFGNFEDADKTADNYIGYPVPLEVGKKMVELQKKLQEEKS